MPPSWLFSTGRFPLSCLPDILAVIFASSTKYVSAQSGDNLETEEQASVELREIPGIPAGESRQLTHDHPAPTLSCPNGWPVQPVPLAENRWKSTWLNIYDAILITMPFLLITKIALVIAAWNKDLSQAGYYIDEVSLPTTNLISFNDQLVTLITIIFVTIISTFVKKLALWKAQKGAYVSDLEQLQGSVSLPSTIKLIWSLRAFSATSLCLIPT